MTALELLIGLALLLGGGEALIRGATAIALRLGVSPLLIGLTLVAVGTSLPELATSVMAALRWQDDLAFRNIVGSNICNILGILGMTGVIMPIAIPGEIIQFDIWVMLLAALMLVVFAVTGWRISRPRGGDLPRGLRRLSCAAAVSRPARRIRPRLTRSVGSTMKRRSPDRRARSARRTVRTR